MIQSKLTADEDGVTTLNKFVSDMAHFGDCRNLWAAIKRMDIEKFELFAPLCRQALRDFLQLQTGIKSLVFGNTTWDKESRMSQLVEDIGHALNWRSDDPAMVLHRDDKLSFPKLKTLQDYSTSQICNDSGIGPFYAKLLDDMPNIEMLEIRSPAYFFRRLELAPEQGLLYTKLATLKISEKLEGKELGLVANSNWKLKGLRLTISSQAHLSELLNKMSPSLEYLTLENVEGSIAIPPCPKLKILSISFSLLVLHIGGVQLHSDPPRFEFDSGKILKAEEENGYFPALEVLTAQIFHSFGGLIDFEEDVPELLQGVFPELCATVFKDLEILRIPENWEFAEEDIQDRFPPDVYISYIEKEDEDEDGYETVEEYETDEGEENDDADVD